MNERDLMASVVDAAEALLRTELVPEDPAFHDALSTLYTRLGNLRLFQMDGNESDRPSRTIRTKTCLTCQAVFFFARYRDLGGSTAGRWLPLEMDPISVEGVLAEWRWVVDFSGSVPFAEPCPDLTEGLVYVDHRQTCGAGKGPKRRCPPYERRWKVNTAKVNAETDNESIRATNDLLALQRKLRGDDTEA